MGVRVHVARLLAVVPLAFVPLACGGRIAGPDGGTSGPQSHETDGGDDTPQQDNPCPLLVPRTGLSCDAPAGQVCAYVGGGIACQAFECDDTGVWIATTDGC
jgi:hypothetical protein